MLTPLKIVAGSVTEQAILHFDITVKLTNQSKRRGLCNRGEALVPNLYVLQFHYDSRIANKIADISNIPLFRKAHRRG